MLENIAIALGPNDLPVWLAQVPVAVERTVYATGPQFFIALIAGIVLAFAFQLLLTNLSVAAGISYLGHQSDDSDYDGGGDSLGGTIRKIGTTVGVWTLITVTIALFFACLLAVKLSLVGNWWIGSIVGLVIWGAYFSLLVWVSSTTVGSLIGSVVNTATSGFQAILGTAAAAFGAKAINNQVVATAEAAAAAVRRELGSGLDPESIRDTLEDYLEALKPPELNFKNIRGEFEKLLSDPEFKAIASSKENFGHINRQTFVDLISNSTDLSKRDLNRIADQLEGVWNNTINQQSQKDLMAEVQDYIKSANPQELNNELSKKLDSVIEEVRQLKQQSSQQSASSGGDGKQKTDSQSPTGLIEQAMQLGATSLLGTIMGRSDVGKLDIQKLTSQLENFKQKATQLVGQVSDKVSPQLYSPIKEDVESYLLATYAWQMSPENLTREFHEVIYDPEANPGTIRRELELFGRADFVRLLQQRGILTQDRINEVADRLEKIRQEVLGTVRAAEEQEKLQDLQRRVDAYLSLTLRENFSAEAIQTDFKALIADSDADDQQLSQRFSSFNREYFVNSLSQRPDTAAEAQIIADRLVETRDRVVLDAQDLQHRLKTETEARWTRLQEYLHNTGKDELNPEGIKRDLKTLLDDPQAGIQAIRARASRFDRDTLVKLLSQRQDLSEQQASQIIERVEDSWHSFVHSPQTLAGKATDKVTEQYSQTTSAIAEYLRNTGKDELDPEGIKRDLQELFHDPKAGAIALRERLSHVDRDTLVKLLSQRQDLSEEQVNRTIDQTLSAISSLIKSPRRLASRTQAKIADFQSTLSDYLRNTGKEELNPEGVQRDLQLLLRDPRAGWGSLSDRLSHVDRSTLVALLSQRQDISTEEANRIVDNILSVRDKFTEQVQNIQRRIQSVIDGIFARIRNYLNSLDRPELNYEGVSRDVRKLFYDPKAGFDALRDRLSHFNRDTLVALISSREDISEADANRLIDQIENGRNSVLQRAERLQQDTLRRVEEVKFQAKKQAEETRKAAETASWWLFGTALLSAAGSALAGALAVLY